MGTLTHVAGTYDTPHGTVSSEWTKGANGITSMKVSVPAGIDRDGLRPGQRATRASSPVAGAATPTGRVDGYQVFTRGARATSRSRRARAPRAPVGGTVPATLSLTLGAPATFGAFTPGVAKDYTASTTANVISTAGDAALTVERPRPPDQRRVLAAVAAAR